MIFWEDETLDIKPEEVCIVFFLYYNKYKSISFIHKDELKIPDILTKKEIIHFLEYFSGKEFVCNDLERRAFEGFWVTRFAGGSSAISKIRYRLFKRFQINLEFKNLGKTSFDELKKEVIDILEFYRGYEMASKVFFKTKEIKKYDEIIFKLKQSRDYSELIQAFIKK